MSSLRERRLLARQLRAQLTLASSFAPLPDWFRNRKAKEQKGRRSRDAAECSSLEVVGGGVRLAQPPASAQGWLSSDFMSS